MRKLVFALAIPVAVACGCTNQGTLPVDPFAPARISPPQTGWLNRSGTRDPYYRTGQQSPPAAAAAPQRAVPTSPASKVADNWHPANQVVDPLAPGAQAGSVPQPTVADSPLPSPGKTRSPGDRISILPAARAQQPTTDNVADSPPRPLPSTSASTQQTAGSRTGASTGSSTVQVTSSERTRIVRTLQPRRTDSSAGSSATRAAANGARNSAQVPSGAQQAEPATFETPVGSRSNPRQAVRLTSAIGPLPRGPMSASHTATGRTTAVASQATADTSSKSLPAKHQEQSSSRYGFDTNYRWLRGRLDYSQIDHRWRLRYIPIDGQTDQYGGSVRLADTSLLSAYRSGQFVEVSGRVIEMPQDNSEYAPLYQIDRIRPLDH